MAKKRWALLLMGGFTPHALAQTGDLVPPVPIPDENHPETEAKTETPWKEGQAKRPTYTDEFRVGIHMGASFANGKVMHDILQDGSVSEQAFDLDWQPSAFGLRSELNFQESGERHYHVNSSFQSIGLRFAPTYQLLPNDASVNVLFYLGVMFNRLDEALDDHVLYLDSTSTEVGGFGGLDVQFHLTEHFDLQLRFAATYQHFHFDEFNSKHNLVQRSVLFGGSYGF